jgi:hypothetical protein
LRPGNVAGQTSGATDLGVRHTPFTMTFGGTQGVEGGGGGEVQLQFTTTGVVPLLEHTTVFVWVIELYGPSATFPQKTQKFGQVMICVPGELMIVTPFTLHGAAVGVGTGFGFEGRGTTHFSFTLA